MARIKRQYDALQATVKLQEDLVRLAVHDMRTPLATIFLHTGTLQLKQLPDSGKWSLDVIKVEAQRLDRFVDELLLLIKFDKEKLRLNYSKVNLKQLVSKAISDSNLLASAAEVSIETDFPNQEKEISLDASLFRRVIDNLLSNAIRQSPTGGKISVSLSYSDPAKSDDNGQAGENGRQGVLLTVSDEGHGIPEAIRDNVFEMVEIVNSRNRGITGPGIGLAFCKLVIAEHNGTISLKENKPRGSVFEVVL
jgi:signal transduction histidine kinase